MMTLELTVEQQRAIDAPLDECVAILGAPGTGKTTALMQRAARARAFHPGAEPLLLPAPRDLGEWAVALVNDGAGDAYLIDDAEAEARFEEACAPLFALEWDEFAPAPPLLDPEVPGLRSPQRFLEAAFRLLRKLRDGAIGPQEFLSLSLSRAADFYAKPPNFADSNLLYATKEAYRDSLDVDAPELQRQYRREVDLAKILAKLYERYVELAQSCGRLTRRDAVARAVELLRERPERAIALRERHRFAFVDEAADLTPNEIGLLQAIFGDALAGVTLSGDPPSAFSAFRGARPETAFACATTRAELLVQHGSPLAVELACRRLTGAAEPLEAGAVATSLFLHRAASVRDEAAFIAADVARAIAAGIPASRIAVLFRSVKSVAPYEEALLQRDIPVVVAGDANIFADRRALDALALLWNVVDPFRHDWMLRTLGNPALALSDASLAILCSEPADLQRALFVRDEAAAPAARASRWDPKRDLRLGWNVVRGDQDAALSPEARVRLERFRSLREAWIEALHTAPFEGFARLVWSEGLACEGASGSARARTQQSVLARLLARLRAYLERNADATAAGALAYAERRASSDLESCEDDCGDEFVRLLDVEAARGRRFARAIVADVRAGAFPRWYAPDAFLFSPRLGMVPKENAGGGRAARTAKFSYYMHRSKARENYNAHERRALVYALRRADASALVTASSAPTRGVAAPEFLEELRNARLPGSEIL